MKKTIFMKFGHQTIAMKRVNARSQLSTRVGKSHNRDQSAKESKSQWQRQALDLAKGGIKKHITPPPPSKTNYTCWTAT